MKEYLKGRGERECCLWYSTVIILRTKSTEKEDKAKVGSSDSF